LSKESTNTFKQVNTKQRLEEWVRKMHLGPASKHIPHTCTKPKHTTHAEATILVLSSMLKTSIQQLVSLSKHTFHWNGIFFHQKTKLMNFMLTLSYMTEAVKLKNPAAC